MSDFTALVSVDLPDSARYELGYTANTVWIRLRDPIDGDAFVHLAPDDAPRLRDNLSRTIVASGRGEATLKADVLLGAMRRNLELLGEFEKVSPAEVDRILAAVVAHIRSWRPTALLKMEMP